MNRWPGALRRANLLHRGVDAVQYLVAVVLLVVAAVVLVRTFVTFLASPGAYPQSLVQAIDGVLVVIIVVDILRTVLTYFEGAGFPLRPFLIIGIISAVRDILSVSAQLVFQTRATGAEFFHSEVELGVSSGVALALVVALVLTRDGQDDGAAWGRTKTADHSQTVSS